MKINPLSFLLFLACIYAPLQSFCGKRTPAEKFDSTGVIIRKSTCGRANGAVLNLHIPANVSWTWKDITGTIISSDTNLINVAPGFYDLQVQYQVSSETETIRFTIGQLQAPVFTENFEVTPPDCGKRTGSISYKNNPDPAYTYAWVNDKHQLITPIAASADKIKDLTQGFYSLRVSLAVDSGCMTYSSPIELANLSGPYFDLSQVKITNATCRLSNGIIRSVYVRNTNGSFFCQWEDSIGTVLSKTIDLFGVPKGKYHMKFKDASICDTLVTPYFVVDGLGYITIDSSALKIRPSDCTNVKGAITGLKTSNVTKFEWMDINTGLIVGNASDLTGLSSGKYQLLTSNSTCNLATKVIAVAKAGFDPIKVASINATDANCDANNGSINSIQFEKNPFAYRFEWKNAAGAAISNSALFANAAPGNYRLLATDSNQCSGEVYTHTLKLFSRPTINYDNIRVLADTCSFGKGAISGLKAEGGAGAYAWTWFNSGGNKISGGKDISSLSAGIYYATVADSFKCTVKGRSIEVSKASVTWPAPVAAGGEVLKGSSATITVENPVAGTYQLFDNISALRRLAYAYDGILKTPAVSEDSHFFIRYDSGSCKSALTDVFVRVITQKDVMVPNGFTPNNDGHNDEFRPLLSRQPEKYQFTIYSRWGTKIFESTEVGKGWKGMTNQLPADAGSYVWVCSYQLPGEPLQMLKGSVVLVR